MLTLYCTPRTISVAAAIVLVETGLDHTLRRVDFQSGEQKAPGYLRVNPKGRVPALQTTDGMLTETGAILEYLAARAAHSSLMPVDAYRAGKLREVMYYLASTMHVNHAHKLRGSRWADQPESHADMAQKVPQTMAESCAYLEGIIGQPFILGRKFTIADAYLFVVCTWLEGDGVRLQDYPKLANHHASVAARPSIETIRAGSLL